MINTFRRPNAFPVRRRLVLVAVCWLGLFQTAAAERPVDFNRDIRPILSDTCFRCHGPSEKDRKADLRFDREESAKQDLGGYAAIVPGKPGESELIARVTSQDEDERMPPADSGKTLSESQIGLLRRWIDQGARWAPYWAYVAPTGTDPPAVSRPDWPLNWIDNYILTRLDSEGLQPAAEADRVTLIRRLSFDLTGLPPTPAEVESFLKDDSPDAYEKLVDRLLASPHFGERMAVWWLDLVRYADSVGYHGDQEQHIWPYRDYVINALNANMPFDQFTREQLAGDLLDHPTQDQLVATGYNRVLQTSHEGGLQLMEYRAIYMADRVRNFSQVWMGATMGCAQCHDHKYDPYTTRDFYSMGAFFADVDDEHHLRNQGTIPGSPTLRYPEMRVYTAAQRRRLEEIAADVKPFEARMQALQREIDIRNDEVKRLESRRAQLDKQLKAIDESLKKEAAKKESAEKNDAEKNTGGMNAAEPDPATGGVEDSKRAARKKRTEIEEAIRQLDARLFAARGVPRLLRKEYDRITRPIAKELRERETIQATVPKTMFTRSLSQPREVHVLPRGNWQDLSGPIVLPAVPKFLQTAEMRITSAETAGPVAANADAASPKAVPSEQDASDKPRPGRATRLDLANWLVTPTSQGGVGPLTARVQANRFWYLLMGRGIARVLDDFGGQGDPPDHPELLDRLALEFVESGWDVKHIMKRIAMSRAYRQSSVGSPHGIEVDPDNRLYARQSRARLPAEMVRDNALAVSGLLVREIGGPSIKPYQPAGYYHHLNFPKREYHEDTDSRQWRRGVYMHWQRQFLHPMLKAFDAPSREECTAQRPVSNTPTAALTLLNDPTFVEAARMFAVRIIQEGGDDDRSRIAWAFRQATSRAPNDEEANLLDKLVQNHRQQFRDDPRAAKDLAGVGLAPSPDGLDLAELAAWTSVGRTILNLNEVVTRN